MILKVARLGFPALRTEASPVPADRIKSKEFQRLIDDMIETMYEYNGVGSRLRRSIFRFNLRCSKSTTIRAIPTCRRCRLPSSSTRW